MNSRIAYLGPPGTYSETAALTYAQSLNRPNGHPSELKPYPCIAQVLKATADGETHYSVVPVENSIEGGVTLTLDTLWQLDTLSIQQALVLPIAHALLSQAKSLETIRTIYSHPQALAQCQQWIEQHIPSAQLIPTQSTTEALQHIKDNTETAAIASERAATMYGLPILAHGINDHTDNCTKFWALGTQTSPGGAYTSLAFSLAINAPGALLKPLKILADHGINLSRIESRPTKRSLGEYLFFLDLEIPVDNSDAKQALIELKNCTETLKILGSYSFLGR
ncbi:prephenate dehydratase [filamentous cyanobacterium CCP5]|nr:prephenate dehydratase [filamentous cyanobacterium CCP5]